MEARSGLGGGTGRGVRGGEVRRSGGREEIGFPKRICEGKRETIGFR